VDLSLVKPVEINSIDLRKHDKKEVEIEKAVIMKVKSQYTKCGYQHVLKVQSVPIESYGEGEDLIEFRASELFNLIQDDDGKLIGYPTGDGSNLVQFMKDIGASIDKTNLSEIVKEIVGKKALIKSYEKDVEGRKRTYLKFRY